MNTTQNPLVSLFIPAYNNLAYTRRTIESVFSQTYRPLELILLDDCSPNSLESLFIEWGKRDSLVDFKYWRNRNNLNFENHRKGFRACLGDYVINMPHDDWFIDNNFLNRAITNFVLDPNLVLYIADSEEEGGVASLFGLPSFCSGQREVAVVKGSTYLRLYDSKRFGNWAWSGVIWSKRHAKYLGLYENPLFVRGLLARRMRIFSDEIVGHLCLASLGNVGLDKTKVSVRGRPKTALTVADSTAVYQVDFRKVINQTVFLLCSRVLLSDKLGMYSNDAKKAALALLFKHIPRQFNIAMIAYSRLPFVYKILYFTLVFYIQPRRFVSKVLRWLRV